MMTKQIHTFSCKPPAATSRLDGEIAHVKVKVPFKFTSAILSLDFDAVGLASQTIIRDSFAALKTMAPSRLHAQL